MSDTDWIPTSEAEELSGYSAYHIRELIHERKVKARKFGAVWQVSRKSLLKYLRQVEKLGSKRGPKSKD